MSDITLAELIKLAWQKIWIIITAFAICAAGAFVVCKFVVTPQYKATASILVTNGGLVNTNQGEYVKGSDISASLYLAGTIVDVLKTPTIYEELSKAIGDEYDPKTLKNIASVSRRAEESLFVDISFVTSDYDDAMKLANKFVDLAPAYIEKYIPSSNAVPTHTDKSVKTSPRTFSTTAIIGIVGAVITYIILLIVSVLNTTISGEQEFSEKYGIRLLGTVPDFESTVPSNLYGNGGYSNEKR